MRIAFLNTITRLARKNPQLMLLTGDLGFSIFEPFQKEFPNQFLNAGVSEQNMTGVAAGLALEGKLPIIYSIVPFVTMRNFEQIRNDICYQNLNVKIVGVGAGFSYGIYGHTHYGLEDIALMRVLPNMTIFSPGDPLETIAAVKKAMTIKGPVYIRLGKAGEPNIHQKIPKLRIGDGLVLEEGKDVTIFVTGVLLPLALEVCSKLKQKSMSISLISMPVLKPINSSFIVAHTKGAKLVVSIEEHSVIGGLGSAIAEILSEQKESPRLIRMGAMNKFHKKTGSQKYMRNKNKLSKQAIVNEIFNNFKKS